MPKLRSSTIDSYLFYKIVHQNSYCLNDNLENFIIIDVGAHIGSFSIAALDRGAEHVYAYEAHPDNFEICKENINRKHNSKSSIYNMAVWRSDKKETLYYGDLQEYNTGQHSVMKENYKENKLKVISLDKVIQEVTKTHGRKIDILKLDCEGSEYPILYTCTQIQSINNIVGEYHLAKNISMDEEFTYSPNEIGLNDFLRNVGYSIITTQGINAGEFFAIRNITDYPFQIERERFE